MEIPERKPRLHLYAGINDGFSGSVPISHSIQLYSKLSESGNRIDNATIIKLPSKTVEPTGLQISGREIWHQSESSGCTLTIFEGGYELLVEYTAKQIINHVQQDLAKK